MPAVDAAKENEAIRRIVLFGKAISDPTRVRLLRLLAQGRGCCGLPPDGLPDLTGGVCVCELQDLFDLGQSRISYHLKILKEAGLIKERPCGKWALYEVDRLALEDCLARCGQLIDPENGAANPTV